MGMKIKISLSQEGRKVRVPSAGRDPRFSEIEAMDVFSSSFEQYFDFKQIDGKSGAESVPILQEVVSALGTEGIANYWVATPGNVGRACARLVSWAKLHPDAIWKVEG